MGVRGELFSARVKSKNDRRTYFFNVKENRNNDVFVTVVESKKTGEGEVFDRHQVVVFEEDLRLFRKGLDTVLDFLDQREQAPGRRPRGGASRDDAGGRKKTRLRRRSDVERDESPATGATPDTGEDPDAPQEP